MASRALALTVVVMLLGTIAAISFAARTAYADDTWWVGKGATANTFMQYNISYRDLNNGNPFTLSIYFLNQDSSGRWIAHSYVDDNGKVVNGTLILGDNLSILRTTGSNIPDDMVPYLSAYANTLQWLNAFSPKSQPKSLTAADWGKLACIGCGDLIPSGKESVNVPAGTYDTTVLVNHYGNSDSKIWVNSDLPYPVQSTFYAAVTSGAAQIQYKYDLLKTGTGEPAVPPNHPNPVLPPLTQTTASGNYMITLDWEPAAIMDGTSESFAVKFADQNGPLAAANYDVSIKAADGTDLQDLTDQKTSGGVGLFTYNFAQGGPATITVTLTSVSGQTLGAFIESTDFHVVVAPEFPISSILIVAAVIGIAVFLTRSNVSSALLGNRAGSL